MKILSSDEWNRICERVSELERHLSAINERVSSDSKIATDQTERVFYCLGAYTQDVPISVSLKDAVKAIIDHLGLKITQVSARPATVALEKVQKKP